MARRKGVILVVDDDKSILRIFTKILQKQGYGTEVAETGQEALERVQGQAYDLALTDVKLPDMSGIDLIAKMRSVRPEMKIITITGFPSIEDATRALDRGATAYLVKPVKAEELIDLVAEKLSG